jgi:hypothetical protein
MYAYAIESDNFCKIGVCSDFDRRMSSYKQKITIKRNFISEIPKNENPNVICLFIESYIMERFNSETEYIYGANYDEIVSCLKESIKKIPNNPFYIKILDAEIYYNSDGYLSINNALDYINGIREEKNKPLPRIDVYFKTLETKMFIDILEKTIGIPAVIGKKGKYGGTCVLPQVLLDFIMWCDSSLKVKTYDFMISEDYLEFISIIPKYKNIKKQDNK